MKDRREPKDITLDLTYDSRWRVFWRSYHKNSLALIAFWVLVILGIVFIVRTAIKGGKGIEHKETPLDILKKRYAQGEITKDEFERMKDDLMKS